MITDDTHSRAISSLGWVDKGSLWMLDGSASAPSSVELSDAEWISLHEGHADYFAAGHHYRGTRLTLTVHSFAEPGRAIACFEIGALGAVTFSGDDAVWAHIPRYYVEYLDGTAAPAGEAGYYLIALQDGNADLQRMNWFYEQSYDLAYQGIVGVCAVPTRPLVLISIQRDSQPVMFHPASRAVIGRMRLADRGGNPTLRFRSERELWADDYDTLLRIDTDDWTVTGSLMLQPTMGDGMRQFIGSYSFTSDGTRCVVARPFSGDIVLVDANRFERVGYRHTGGQPLEGAVFADGRVVFRDWKTGTLLTTQL